MSEDRASYGDQYPVHIGRMTGRGWVLWCEREIDDTVDLIQLGPFLDGDKFPGRSWCGLCVEMLIQRIYRRAGDVE